MKTIMDFAESIISNNNLIESNLKYCFVDYTKRPFRYDGEMAHPNKIDDFVDIVDLLSSNVISNYDGIGISIQASNICAIDVDHCFSTPFDINSGNDKSKDIINIFSKVAYIEFSFSGTGLRILFRNDLINDYENNYYIKNSKEGIEFYQPSKSFRYVTITGQFICNNPIVKSNELSLILNSFLDKYMKRPLYNREIPILTGKDGRSIEELMILVKRFYIKDFNFQDVWFTKAPGSGKDESERDFKIIAFLFENVTQDSEKIKEIFEKSPFFKSKDYKHKTKWERDNNKYFYYWYNKIRGYNG